MKTERYLLKYIRERGISEEALKRELGIDLKQMADGGEDLPADKFLEICRYLDITPEQVIAHVL